jgi:hypothetical protein
MENEFKTKIPLNKGDYFVPSGYIYPATVHKVTKRLFDGNPKNCVVVCVEEVDTGNRRNMVENYVFKPGSVATASHSEVIKGAKQGDKNFVREFIKRFKKIPKFSN